RAADHLSDLVAEIRTRRRAESVGRSWTGVDDDIAAAEIQLPRNAGSDMGRVRLSGHDEGDGRDAECLNAEGRTQNAESRKANAKCKMQNAKLSGVILHFAFCILHSCAETKHDFHDARRRGRARPSSVPPASLRGSRAAARSVDAGD